MDFFIAKEVYEGTLRMIMEYGATVSEHIEFIKTCLFF